ncbi:MAG: hypothetical protein GY943_13210 [Chloroflexi bacterium]|nr:hypothetical protein [Chloroflexota bacterium]
MNEQTVIPSVQIPPVTQSLNPLAMGGFYFGSDPWEEQRATLWSALETAVSKGINHLDTATDYGEGQSERPLGEFLSDTDY